MKAFWRTLILATFRPKRLAGAAAGPVDSASANRFRSLIVAIASLAVIGGFVGVVSQHGGTSSLNLVDSDLRTTSSGAGVGASWEASVLWSAGATLAPVLPIGVLATVTLWSLSPMCWRLPAELPPVRRRRAIALGAYACAPLGWLAICIALLAGLDVLASDQFLGEYFANGHALLWTLRHVLAWGSVFTLAAWWWTILRLLRGGTHCDTGRLIIVAVVIPITWGIAAMLGLVALPCLVGLVRIAIDSLR